MQTQAMADKPPRYYQLNIQEDLIDGWTLVREWGQQGSPGRVKQDHFATLEQAVNACMSVRDAQIQRGYRVVFTHGQELGA
ncbi:MAG: WGR domain-containing protein [Gammaproteobacteria bacterium]|nr:WGR domain-containing protein [Gammaproteobacteria bacterium]MDH5653997.1 WGR domain-containing protein [Gammaproteobacteria bacterium]